MNTYRNPASGREHGEYTWCAACQRADQTTAWERSVWACPHCGGVARDARPWEDVQEHNPGYPHAPEAQSLYLWDGAPPAAPG